MNSAVTTSSQTRRDLVELTKARLSTLVVVTTGAGFIAGWPDGKPFDWMLLFHTIFGTLLSAFGAAAFNQLIEMRQDARMKRTSERPLPAGRMPPAAAFVVGWLLCAFGLIHLGLKVNIQACMLSALTLVTYIFVYTPMKRRSSWNTIVGAVSGAIPPVIGWVAAGRELDAGAAWWFALLFFWQLPHFYAINWIHREEYQKAGFVMLANGDPTGVKTSRWAFGFSLALAVLAVIPPMIHLSRWWFVAPGLALAGALAWLAWRFMQERTKESARKLFLSTLLYLPVVLGALLLAAW